MVHRYHQLPDLFHASIADLSASLWQGTLMLVVLTRAYLACIRSTQKLNAVLTISPYALVEATNADIQLTRLRAECSTTQVLCHRIPPLPGIPYMAKDNIAIPAHVGPTTAGSFALLDTSVREASAVMQQLARAGAVLLGTTNMDECVWSHADVLLMDQLRFAWEKGKAPWGWAIRHAVAKEIRLIPQVATYVDHPAAAGIGLSAFALGMQTGWSIVCPSAKLGIVSLKPGPGVLDMKESSLSPGTSMPSVPSPAQLQMQPSSSTP
jgi:amidase